MKITYCLWSNLLCQMNSFLLRILKFPEKTHLLTYDFVLCKHRKQKKKNGKRRKKMWWKIHDHFCVVNYQYISKISIICCQRLWGLRQWVIVPEMVKSLGRLSPSLNVTLCLPQRFKIHQDYLGSLVGLLWAGWSGVYLDIWTLTNVIKSHIYYIRIFHTHKIKCNSLNNVCGWFALA